MKITKIALGAVTGIACAVVLAGCHTPTDADFASHRVADVAGNPLRTVQTYAKCVWTSQEGQLGIAVPPLCTVTSVDEKGIHYEYFLTVAGSKDAWSHPHYKALPRGPGLFSEVYQIKVISQSYNGNIWLYDRNGKCILGIPYGYPAIYGPATSVGAREVCERLSSALVALCPNAKKMIVAD